MQAFNSFFFFNRVTTKRKIENNETVIDVHFSVFFLRIIMKITKKIEKWLPQAPTGVQNSFKKVATFEYQSKPSGRKIVYKQKKKNLYILSIRS